MGWLVADKEAYFALVCGEKKEKLSAFCLPGAFSLLLNCFNWSVDHSDRSEYRFQCNQFCTNRAYLVYLRAWLAG